MCEQGQVRSVEKIMGQTQMHEQYCFNATEFWGYLLCSTITVIVLIQNLKKLFLREFTKKYNKESFVESLLMVFFN